MMGRVHVPSSSRLFLSVVFVMAFGLSAASVRAATLTVDTTADTTNATNDCSTGAGTACSLRDAITQANTDGSGDTIQFGVTGTITLGSALPAITVDVTINGPTTAPGITISGANTYRVLSITGGAVTLNNLTIANGKVTGNAPAGAGGGIFDSSTGLLAISNCTFLGNQASVYGGAIAVIVSSGSGSLTVTNSTFSGNGNSSVAGGALYLYLAAGGTETVINSTFTGNTASSAGGGAIYDANTNGTLTVENSILSGDSDECDGTGGGCPTNGTNGNVVGGAADLLPLGNYGGPTETYLPLPTSPAVCTGISTDIPGGVTTDQRGFPINPIWNPCATGKADAGAVQSNYITVTNNGESPSAACPNNTKCTLREAVATANGQGDIAFGVSSVTLSGSGLTLSVPGSGVPGVNIVGSATSQIKVDGGAAGTVFTVGTGLPAVFWGLNITNGKVTGSGGGINNSGDVTLGFSTVTANTASVSGGNVNNAGTMLIEASTISSSVDAGGINNASGSTLTVMDSTISGNNTLASGNGGGISNAGTAMVVESTVSGNKLKAGGLGGGIYNATGSTLTVINSTISGNVISGGSGSDDGGGVYAASGGTASLANTIVSGNTSDGSDPDIASSTYTDNGGNVIGGTVNLAVLGVYGPNNIQTQIPLPGGTNGNPAICAGTSANVPATVTNDERGEPISPNDCPSGFVDAGAVQTNYTSITFSASPSGTNTVDAALSPAPAVALYESSQQLAAAGAGITMTLSSGTLYGGTGGTTVSSSTATASTDNTGTATFSGLVSTAATGLSLNAAVQLNSTLQLTASSTPTFSTFDVGKASTSVVVTASGSNPASPVVNDSLTFIATISPQNATVPYDTTNGTVTFTDTKTSKALCSNTAVTVTSGVASASCTTTALDQQTHTISAVYNGDTNYAPTTTNNVTTLNVTVGKAPTYVTVSGPSTGAFGSSISFSATVTPLNSDVPFTGTVTFTNTTTSTTLCSNVAIAASTGVATCQTSSLAQGSATISAVYNGDSNYLATTSGNVTTLSVLVGKANPTGSLTCTSTDSGSPTCATSITPGSSETFTETVTGPNGAATPTGKVTFLDGTSTISGCGGSSGVSLDSNGSAQCQTTLSGGAHTIIATYKGDTNYNSVTNTLSVGVGQTSTTTSISSSTGGTSTVNQSVTFNVAITPANLSPAPTGSVTVVDTSNSNAQICYGQLSSQSFSCSTQALARGTHNIEAQYSGDSNYSPSSGTVTQTVNAGTATISSFSTSSNPAVVNNNVTFTATVSVPSGPISPDGYVHFTSNNVTISGCDKVALTLSSPGATSGTAQCSTSSLAASATPYTIAATFTDTNGNFTQASNSLQQTVSSSATTVTIAAAPSTTTVNVPVTYTVTATAASTTNPLTGTVQVADNGTVVCSGLTLTQASGSTTGTTSSCTESNLTAGVHTITATYNLDHTDLNNGTGSGSTTVPVAPASTSVVVTSSLNPSVVANPNNVNDTVTFAAMVSTTDTLSVPLSGTVSFTENGLTIPGCAAVPATAGAAYCTATDLPAGADTILAVYSNDPNYTGSSGYLMTGNQISPQLVQDYSLVISSAPPVVLTQGYTTSSDLFSAQTISVVPISVQEFTTAQGEPLSLTCSTVGTIYSPVSPPVQPTCKLATTSLAVSGTGAEGAVGIVVDATNASPGIYTVGVMGKDPTTGLKRTSTFTVQVRAASDPLTVVSGATTGNTGNLTFMLPATISLTNLRCQSVSGPNLTGSESPASLGISCTFNPTTIAASSSMQAAQVTVTVNTGGSSTTTTAAVSRETNLYLGGLLGLPLFGLMGLIRGRKSPRSVFFRLIAILVICFAAFQVMGCGGSFATQPTNSGGGTTPPGVYKVLVVGTGSDGQTYQAVLQLNVQL